MGLHCFTLFCPLQTFNAFSTACTVYTPKSITMREKATLYFGYNNWAIALFHSFSLHNFNLDTTHVHTYLGDVWISKQTYSQTPSEETQWNLGIQMQTK